MKLFQNNYKVVETEMIYTTFMAFVVSGEFKVRVVTQKKMNLKFVIF